MVSPHFVGTHFNVFAVVIDVSHGDGGSQVANDAARSGHTRNETGVPAVLDAACAGIYVTDDAAYIGTTHDGTLVGTLFDGGLGKDSTYDAAHVGVVVCDGSALYENVVTTHTDAAAEAECEER